MITRRDRDSGGQWTEKVTLAWETHQAVEPKWCSRRPHRREDGVSHCSFARLRYRMLQH